MIFRSSHSFQEDQYYSHICPLNIKLLSLAQQKDWDWRGTDSLALPKSNVIHLSAPLNSLINISYYATSQSFPLASMGYVKWVIGSLARCFQYF